VKAPVTGRLINFTLRQGSSVNPNQVLFSLIDTHAYWVNAYYKETQLANVHPGQAATITLDHFVPQHIFTGSVQAISYGSSAAFALFPAENATSNLIKVTQRFPVKIMVQDPDPHYPLRVGASATVVIDTRQ
jgi:membrane fusion protein, multidrug efflux system